MKTLWEKLNDATQPGASVETKQALADIAEALNWGPKEEPVLYVLKRAQRLAQMSGKVIRTEEQYLYWIGQARGNLAAHYGVKR